MNAIKTNKLFTKSAFKIALTCPRQLYYYYDCQNYANQNTDDSFLQALAEGGFQVGELAKIYYGIDENTDIKTLDYTSSVEETKRLLVSDTINIAEAAFRYKNCFVRVDILRKTGHTIELIEVKAKSWDAKSSFTQKRSPNKIAKDILPYLYDVAFQKWVVVNALKELYPDTAFKVKASLMMADKDKKAEVDGMNQCFRIERDVNKRIKIVKAPHANTLNNYAHVLTAFDVDELCDKIICGETEEQDEVMRSTFEPFVEKMADSYCNHKMTECTLGSQCFSCPFYTTAKDSPKLKDGYKECWIEKAKFADEDFDKPLVKDLWGAYIRRGDFIKNGKYFMKDLSKDDFNTIKETSTGLNHIERKLLQIGLASNNKELLEPFNTDIQDGIYIDVDGLKDEMSKWKFPLHMIDFETTAVALPFYKGLHPYEQIAFQFSHHIIRKAVEGKGYTIEHAGQYLNTQKGYFPNFEFIRELKQQLEEDDGAVFRYATHENTILRNIYSQLAESQESDKEELMNFIDTISHADKMKKGVRDMIDLLEVVKRYFYHPIMKGSNSIKVVLPAVLNSSKLLKEKYSQPIYGREIVSQNYSSQTPQIWIKLGENGEIENPYKHLEPISSFLDIKEEEISQYEDSLDESVCNGGAALAAYSKLQFSDNVASHALEEALLRYCELDTLAMVFIWEYFNEMTES